MASVSMFMTFLHHVVRMFWQVLICCAALLWEVAAGTVVEALGMRISLSPH